MAESNAIPIVSSVISVLSAAVSAGIAAWVTLHMEKKRKLSEVEKLVAKYSDPLLLAAHDLQGRIANISLNHFLVFYYDETRHDFATIYTVFLIGQFLSWTYILRRQVQFLRFETDSKTRRLSSILANIQDAFSTTRKDEELFMLWRPQQMAIGEIMTVTEAGEMYCCRYSDFSRKYKNDAGFRHWLAPIEGAISQVAKESIKRGHLRVYRLQRLQHLLIDLITELDPELLYSGGKEIERVEKCPHCRCSHCTEQKKNLYHGA